MAHAVLSLNNLSIRYDGKDVLRNISLTVTPKSFQFLTGPSGAGKTTLLSTMMLKKEPDTGFVTLFGQNTATLNAKERALTKRRIGMVFQDFRLLPHLTVTENIGLPFAIMGKSEESYKQDVLDLIAWVGLIKQKDSYPHTLSAGEKQRAAIARAIITKPEILLADEPTGNVDSVIAKKLLRLFLELNRCGTAVIIATHDISLIEQHPCRVLFLTKGEVREYAPSHDGEA